MNRTTVIRRGAAEFRQRIITAKIGTDELLNAMSQLLATTSGTSLAAGVSSAEAQPTLESIGKAINGVIEARGLLVGAHVSARNAVSRHLPEFAGGDVEDTPIIPYVAIPSIVPEPAAA